MGITVCDLLREDSINKNKVVEINNAQRVYDTIRLPSGNLEKTTKIMKEELYNNLKKLGEQEKVILLNDDDVKTSLRSIQAEHDPRTGKMRIWGSYSHIVEGLIRACWCTKGKTLSISKFYGF